MGKMRQVGLVCVLLLLAAGAGAQGDGEYEYPLLRVPRVEKPPRIDGIIRQGEYEELATFTGVVRYPGGGPKSIVPSIQQVIWYIGYDDENLYLALHSPHAEGTWPAARVKSNDEGAILWDDHVEIQFATRGREYSGTPGKGFYKIMVNPRGAVHDSWYFNGTPGTEDEWSFSGQVKCSVTESYWDMEMSIPIVAFEEQKLDGRDWVVQLVRADRPGGVYFAGWVGATWMEWGQFGKVIFDPRAPAFRFSQTGQLSRGEMDLRFELTGCADAACEVDVTVTATDGDGQVIYRQTRTAKLGPRATQGLRFAGKLELTEEGNTVELYATYRRTGAAGKAAQSKTLYHVRMPVVKMTDALWAQYIKPWLERRPKGEPDYRFAYWPSCGVARASVDVDFFGMDRQIAEASGLQITVRQRGNGKVFASERVGLKNKRSSLVLKVGQLPEGKYEAAMQLYGADGTSVVGEKIIQFVREHYPWEGNDIGKDNRVFYPYEPIKVQGNHLRPWGRDYEIGQNGLPAMIVAGGGAGLEKILRGPIRLEGRAGGEPLKVKDARLNIHKATDARVDLSASGRLGPAKVEVQSYMEFDGWYQVALTVSPARGSARLEGLDLVIPLWSAADTIYVQRRGDCRPGNKFGAIPEGEGVVWHSGMLLDGDKDSFAPIVYLGTGDKGLWWFAEENRAWTGSPDKPAIEVSRSKEGVDLRFRFFAAPVELKSSRTVVFALLADPVKPTVDPVKPQRCWRQMAWGWPPNYHGGVYAHCTFGYRYWGGSVDGYENTDADLEALRDLLLGKRKPVDSSGKWWQANLSPAAENGDACVVYGSTSLTGLGLPAFDTYGGEWLGRTNWATSPQMEFKGRTNLQNTITWETPRQLTTVGVNFTRSYEDCFVWYHARLFEKVPINGTWWDNSSITRITDYDPGSEEFYTRYNVFTRRRLTKRLWTAQWEMGCKPLWINNMHVDWSWCQVSWHIENDFYINSPSSTMMDELSVDQFRAMCRIKQGIIHRLATRYGVEGGPTTVWQQRKRARSIVGLCLLHDIGAYLWGNYADEHRRLPEILHEKVGFFDGAQFTGYWRSRHLVELDTPKVYASVYQGKGRAAIVVVNENKEPVDVPFRLHPELLPDKKIERLYDAETGYEFEQLYDRKARKRRWGEYFPGRFGIEGHGVRMLVAE